MTEARTLSEALKQHGLMLFPMARSPEFNMQKEFIGMRPPTYLVHNDQGKGNTQALQAHQIWVLILDLEKALASLEPDGEEDTP